jgi:hypothetical protein
MTRKYFYKSHGSFIEITSLGSSTKLYFYGRDVSISIGDSLVVINLCEPSQNVDFSNLESKTRTHDW